MSDSLAIAAITNALRALLQTGLTNADNDPTAGSSNVLVTTLPPDKVQTGGGNKVNLFLYQANINPSWRNMDVPWQTRPGETKPTPLPLDLYYLITVYYGENEDGIDTATTGVLSGGHRLLGRAMRILHDHPNLSADEINHALPQAERLHHPYGQPECVHITPHPLSIDEVSKIWTGFQTQYRLSAAYEASVVLIESTRPARTPVPVLQRGEADRGVKSIFGPFPQVGAVGRPRATRPGIQLGDVVELIGQNLGGMEARVRFRHARLDQSAALSGPNELPALDGSTNIRLSVQLPLPSDNAALPSWPAGYYQVTVRLPGDPGEPDAASNQMSLLLAPILNPLTMFNQHGLVARDAQDRLFLAVESIPPALSEQSAVLMVGSHALTLQPYRQPPGRLLFAGSVPVMDKFAIVRLRVDGVDSLAFTQVDPTLPPVFDTGQMVKVRPSLLTGVTVDPDPLTAGAPATVTVTCHQPVEPHQVAVLEVDGQTINAEAHPNQTMELQFHVTFAVGAPFAVVHLLLDGEPSAPLQGDPAVGYELHPGFKVDLTWIP